MALRVETAPLLPAIGGTVVSGTVGSVLFVGTGPVLAQDNTNFFWDDPNNRLGIAVAAAPSYTLDVGGFINTNTASGYKQNGQTILRGLTTGGTANYLTAVGAGAMPSATGTDNTAVGYDSLNAVTSGAQNVAIGSGALQFVQTASLQTAVGYQALRVANNSSLANTAVGSLALTSNTSGTGNTAIGGQALQFNVTGVNNMAMGYLALQANTASSNAAIGALALTSNTSGTGNIAIGIGALQFNLIGNNNVGVGYLALQANTGSSNMAVGALALNSNAGGGSNTAIGTQALQLNVSGNYNVAVGDQSLQSNTASVNTGVGFQALYTNSSGTQNAAIGFQAGYYNQTGSNLVAAGYRALFSNTASNNIAVGYQAGDNITSGATNLVIGYNIDAMSATASNQMTIGNYLFATGIDGTGTTVSAAKFGLGVPAPTAKLSVVAGTSSIPQVNLASSTAPSSPAAGDIWYDGTDVVFKDGVKCATIDTGNGAVELAAGTYTPTLTNTANIAASTAYQCQYLRVGATVNVSGMVDIDPTAGASTNTQLTLTLPVASSAPSTEDVAGTAVCSEIASYCGAVSSNATGKAILEFKALDATTRLWFFNFSYQIN